MQLLVCFLVGVGHVTQCLPERIKFLMSLSVGIAAYASGYDVFLDFWDMAIVTAPNGCPSSMLVSRADVVVLAGVGHISTTLIDIWSPHCFDLLKVFL